MMPQYLYTGTMISNQAGVDIGMSSTSSDQPKELCSSGDEHIPKVRKTYTITKQRERWTDEEHTKFLDALKLYGRTWRKIEERVGTKTAVQIRSHAQKFFSKVVRESASNSTGSTKPIEIPPPRPKRKPLHPYPRKLATSSSKKLSALKKPERSHSPTKSISEAQTGSPTSVLSPIGSDAMGSNTPKPCGSLDSYVSNSRVTGLFRNVQESIFHPYPSAAEEENGSPSCGTNSSDVITDKKSDVELEDTSVEAPITSLKLFGKTVVITEVSSTSAPLTTHDLESFRLDDGDGSKVGIKKDEQTSTPEPTENVTASMTQQDSYSVSCQVPWNPWSCVAPPFLYPMKQEIKNESSTTIAAPLPWWPFFGGLPFSLNSCFNEHLPESGKSTTSLDSKVHPLDHNEPKTDDSNSKSSSEKQVRGFMPYKRCSSEREEDYQTSEEENHPRIRMCL